MSGPCVRIPFWVRVFLLLLLHRVSAGCPELLSSGCSCAEDRGKAHPAPGARRKVSCGGKELTETPEIQKRVSLNMAFIRQCMSIASHKIRNCDSNSLEDVNGYYKSAKDKGRTLLGDYCTRS
ncbi:hypothetical protein PO909_018021 [Leuciscus waleckii]